ncbi:M42 family metallopeptidase [Thermoflavimicrobium dichotomicum]|uniref:Putative aminopeptidase FrvX n=1 Tax=Thermoflavimicrobium dichotomicum TaxID=46223 RepID=A0A1I3L617_9BACL|nr:M42 family metallopeptidase [Thermoflavimicrobium dichotomicum]SFI79865.1 Putative aminopeptidase FrvX [Thermoflavimicrobium dichotomicum]
MDSLEKLMKDLIESDGTSGFERDVAKKMEEYMIPYSEEIVKDRLGSIVAKKTGHPDGPRVLIAGHMDEIGFMVTHITDDGFLKFQPIGFWWTHNLLHQRVKVKSTHGDYLGIIGGNSLTYAVSKKSNQLMEIKDMYIDVGANSKERVKEMGIRLGDPVVPLSDFFTMQNGEIWGGKAMDNRVGCALAIETLRRLQKEEHPNVVWSGATVQEEVGLRGAATLAHLVDPDIALVVDIIDAYDTPNFRGYDGKCRIGDGPVLVMKDVTMIGHRGLRDLIVDTAKELGIPLQFDSITYGGTDGGKFHVHGIGCPTIFLAIPTRYAHSHNTIMSRQDFEQAATLLTAVVKKLDQNTFNQMIG